MASVLLVDDNRDIKSAVAAVLNKEHTVEWAQSLSEAQQLIRDNKKFDLVLLDVDLPDGNGFDFLATVARDFEAQGIGVIFLTGTNSVDARTRGFELGALDYISKPFDLHEFYVRINAKIKMSRPKPAPAPLLKKGNIHIDLTRGQAFELIGETLRLMDLTPVEFRLLLLLLQHDGEIVPRQKILGTVWGDGTHVSSRSVDHHICGLRKKISATGQKIESVYGVGYRLEIY